MGSPLLRRQGAVGEAVPQHYGEPLREQRLLASGQTVVDCSHFEVISLDGPDRLIWLDSITSNVFVGIGPEETREGLILDPHGRIEHRFLLRDDGETAWLLVEPGCADSLVSWLEKMRFRMDVTIRNRTSDVAVLACVKEHTPESLAGFPSWVDPWPSITPGGVAYSGAAHPGADTQFRFVQIPRAELSEQLSPHWAGTDALDALLIRSGRPLLVDVDEKTIPHELDWLRTAVHLDKGCYRGQETVAKVHNLGHPPRRAVLLHLDGRDVELPEAGAPVFSGERVVGRVTRVARHYEWGPIAFAVVKRTTPVDEELEVQGPSGRVVASQELLVLPDSGATRREALLARKAGSR